MHEQEKKIITYVEEVATTPILPIGTRLPISNASPAVQQALENARNSETIKGTSVVGNVVEQKI